MNIEDIEIMAREICIEECGKIEIKDYEHWYEITLSGNHKWKTITIKFIKDKVDGMTITSSEKTWESAFEKIEQLLTKKLEILRKKSKYKCELCGHINIVGKDTTEVKITDGAMIILDEGFFCEKCLTFNLIGVNCSMAEYIGEVEEGKKQ